MPVRRFRRGLPWRWLVPAALALIAGGAFLRYTRLPAGTTPSASPPLGTTFAAGTCPWLDPGVPVAQRVAELMGQMSLADEILLVHGTAVAPYAGGIAPQPSLCIPAVHLEDGPVGVGDGMNGVTQFPAGVALASSWDPQLAYAFGQALGAEQRGKGVTVDLGPTINILRVPLWGRSFESLGEDPYLTGHMVAPEIEGIQSQGVIAQVKHLAVYNQETYRNTPADDAIVSERAMREIYLPAFREAIVSAHVGSIMCAYSTINGQYACQDPALIRGDVDQTFGFPGFVTSDWGATHATARSAAAGLDLEMPGSSHYGTELATAIQAGRVPRAELNDMVARILTEMFRFGLFQRTGEGNPAAVVTTPAHAALALSEAEQGTVLLKNADHVLPLGPTTGSIAVIGADAGTAAVTAGGGSAHVNPPYVVTPCQGIAAAAPKGVAVTCDASDALGAATAAATAAKVAVVFVSDLESEGADLSTLSLPGNDDALIQAVAGANPATIVVINSGTPVLMPWLGTVPAVLEAWYPGQEDGNAIAAILFGSVDPSGHLPMTFPTGMSQTPVASSAAFPGQDGKVDYSEGILVGYRWYGAKHLTPLFPFGDGLSYTTFAFSDLRISQGTTDVLHPESVGVTVTNTGSREGADVVQLYLGDPASTGEPPEQLKGFQRVTLAPGQSSRIHFTVTPHAMAYWDTAVGGWVAAPGTYAVLVGDSSANLPARGQFILASTTGARQLTIAAPATLVPGRGATVTVRLSPGGNMALRDVHLAITAPSGWQVRARSTVTYRTLTPGQAAVSRFTITAPFSAQERLQMLTATATVQGGAIPPGAGGPAAANCPPSSGTTLCSGFETRATVHVPAAVTDSLSPATLALRQGQTAQITLSLSNRSAVPLVARWQLGSGAETQSGFTFRPASGSIRLGAGAHVRQTVRVSAVSGGTPGSVTLPVHLAAVIGKVAYPNLGVVALTATLPYASLQAAFDNVGITSAAAAQAGNLDDTGDSFPAQALATAGLRPGATVDAAGVALTWPDVSPGQPDNVVAAGQAISLSGSGSHLVIAGASDFGTGVGAGEIVYTDGSTQTFTLSLADWYANSAAPGSQILVTSPDWSPPNGGQNQGSHPVSLYVASIPLSRGRTVADVILPNISRGTKAGTTALHVFAIGIG